MKRHHGAFKVYHPSYNEWRVETNDGEKKTIRIRTDHESKTHYLLFDDKIVDSFDFSGLDVFEIEDMDKISHNVMNSIIEMIFRNNN